MSERFEWWWTEAQIREWIDRAWARFRRRRGVRP